MLPVEKIALGLGISNFVLLNFVGFCSFYLSIFLERLELTYRELIIKNIKASIARGVTRNHATKTGSGARKKAPLRALEQYLGFNFVLPITPNHKIT